NDYIYHSIEESLEDGMEIEHIPAKEVAVVIDGKKVIYETIAEDVKTLFKEHKLDITKHDKVSHNINTEIKDGLVINIYKANKKEQVTKNTEIEVTKVTKDTIVEKEATNFEVKEEKNSKLEKGKTNVIQKGRKGSVEKTYELVLENGKEVERKEVDKEVLKK